ncbi:MAG: TetR/AcrR family transcriptional regulator [Candidatus Eisenbacteria bacterium]
MTSLETSPGPHPSRTKLLDASLHVIRSRGYSATRIEDVCAEAGLTKGSFFHHFRTKEELAVAAADHFGRMAEGVFAAAPYRELSDPVDHLLGYVEFRQSILERPIPEFTCLLGTMVQETYDTHPAIRDACDRNISAHAHELERDVESAREMYAPDADWTPESLALHTQAVIQGAFVLAKAKGSSEVAVEMLGHLRRYLGLLFGRSDPARSRG